MLPRIVLAVLIFSWAIPAQSQYPQGWECGPSGCATGSCPTGPPSTYAVPSQRLIIGRNTTIIQQPPVLPRAAAPDMSRELAENRANQEHLRQLMVNVNDRVSALGRIVESPTPAIIPTPDEIGNIEPDGIQQLVDTIEVASFRISDNTQRLDLAELVDLEIGRRLEAIEQQVGIVTEKTNAMNPAAIEANAVFSAQQDTDAAIADAKEEIDAGLLDKVKSFVPAILVSLGIPATGWMVGVVLIVMTLAWKFWLRDRLDLNNDGKVTISEMRQVVAEMTGIGAVVQKVGEVVQGVGDRVDKMDGKLDGKLYMMNLPGDKNDPKE